MTNADLFKATFGMYSTELWAMPEREFLDWMNTEVEGMDKSISCGHEKDELISRRVAIDALRAIKYGLWEIDIPSPTVPEYVEHHEQIKNMMEIVDGWIKRVKEEPAVDAVPVVRCRDCNKYQQNFHWCKLHDGEMQPTDYCSYGERREENAVD